METKLGDGRVILGISRVGPREPHAFRGLVPTKTGGLSVCEATLGSPGMAYVLWSG